ncbi:calmodulin-binding transcription activator 1-like [Centruroides sculpturatus]|uniref:calmodulin-binding transcription activator 1-like n=1 Tax=Centruroides sculpturatus TaxID=218467 RepID=UPI000C6E756E|nr:calmodulin-binding transcription activator 1-like [Centruroides sculpturatus]
MLLYSRKRVRYRRDGYCWKKRKDGKTTREDHMKLKVQGTECIYGCYVHSAILPTFHRRCYWLLQNSDVVLVHYLNVPYSDDNKLLVTPSLSYCADKKEWTKEELVSQLKPMFYSENEPDLNNELEISTAETVEAIVQQLMEKQRAKAAVRTHECACDSTTKSVGNTSENKKCSHTLHRIISPKSQSRKMSSSNSTVSTTTNHVSSSTTLVAVSQAGIQKVEETANKRTVGTTRSATTVTATRTGSVILAAPCQPVLKSNRQKDLSQTSTTATTSLILNLSHLQEGSGLLILNSATAATEVGLASASVTPVTFLCGQETVTTSHTQPTTSVLTSSLANNNSDMSHVEDTIDCDNQNEKTVFCTSPNGKDPNFGSIADELPNKKKDNLSFFEDALTMPQDLQKTPLSANMLPPKCLLSSQISVKTEPNHSNIDPVDLSPMDFIDNDISTPDEEVFSLDTFDMLSDLPNLDEINPDLAPSSGFSMSSPSALSISSGLGSTVKSNSPQSIIHYRDGTANITDYSPDWSYTEGGVKVLVTGPWYSTSSPYSVLFDRISVPTTLVQSGVLRCYCPSHEAGLVSLQVACDGFVISNSVTFEYRHQPSSISQKTDNWFDVEETTLKFSLLERLELMGGKINFNNQDKNEVSSLFSQVMFGKENSFEDRLVTLCQHLMSATWVQRYDASPLTYSSCPGLTLLHLAAALGYSRLVCSLLHWRAENPSLILEAEVDALSRDKHDCTPLMWACERGHKEVALLLYQWNRTAVKVTDTQGRNPLSMAKERGYDDLVEQIEKTEQSLQIQDLVNTSGTDSLLQRNLTVKLQMWACERGHKEVALLLYQWNRTAVKVTDTQGRNPLSMAKERGYDDLVEQIEKTEQSLQIQDLMWACERGHKEVALLLYQWNRTAVKVTDTQGRNPLSMAKERGYDDLVEQIEKTEQSLQIQDLVNTSGTDSLLQSRNILKLFKNFYYFHLLIEECLEKILNVSGEIQNNNESPYIDVVGVSDEEAENKSLARNGDSMSNQKENCNDINITSNHGSETENHVTNVLTLAEQIIAAMPDHIKATTVANSNEITDTNGDLKDDISHSFLSQDPEMCSVEGSPPSLTLLNGNSIFEFSDQNYRYCDVGTPSSSLSPASSCLQSPGSFTLESPSPPPTTADFCEFFQASGKMMETDFSKLTLSDQEQRELYEAAKIIQKAYRSYKGQKQQEEDEKERAAAILIQSYYRRYKQYMYYKQMTKAAQLIQNQFRNYCEHKRFKKSQEGENGSNLSGTVSPLHSNGTANGNNSNSNNGTNYYYNFSDSDKRLNRDSISSTTALKRTFSQRRQHQAARKIQQFLRQSKNNIWDYLHGKVSSERTCISSRKREASSGTSESTGSAPKIPGTTYEQSGWNH